MTLHADGVARIRGVTNPFVIPAGEPDLVKALLNAASTRGARNVHQYPGVSGWHTSDAKPRGIKAYFRVSGPKIWIRTGTNAELLVATVVDGQIAWEKDAQSYLGAV